MLIALLIVVALVLASLGAGRAVLGSPDSCTRHFADGITGLTGLAVITWTGGWLVLSGIYSQGAGWGLLAAGCGMLVAGLIRDRGERPISNYAVVSAPAGALVLGLLSLGLVLGRAFGELVVPISEPWDDWLSYWHFPRLILESGGFIEPFNARRLTALGAAPFAQSFFWPEFRIAANGMTDAVLGQLLLWAVVRKLPDALSTRPRPAWFGEALALAALLISLTIPNKNSQPTLLPMAGALVLILLTRRLTTNGEAADGIRTSIAWGLVAAWLIGLRTGNVVFPAVLWLGSALMAARHSHSGPQAQRLAIAALATALGLLPWGIALWQSSGVLYPLIAGNYHAEVGFYSVPLDTTGLAALIGDRLWMSRVWIVAAIGAVAAFRPALRSLVVQVIIAVILLVVVSAAGATRFEWSHIHRYSAPFLAASVIFFAATALAVEPAATAPDRAAARRDLIPLMLWAGLLFWLAMSVRLPASSLPGWTSLPDGRREWPSNLREFAFQANRRVTAALVAWQMEGRIEVFHQEPYAAAQALLPADARLLSTAERPYLFRFDQQVVHTLDFFGVVSPAPGMPFFRGPEPLVQYLRDLGYTHLAYTPAHFLSPGEIDVTVLRENPEIWSRTLDFMENTERLRQSYPVIYRSEDIVVIDIRQSHP